jgi:hypothetical protein
MAAMRERRLEARPSANHDAVMTAERATTITACSQKPSRRAAPFAAGPTTVTPT